MIHYPYYSSHNMKDCAFCFNFSYLVAIEKTSFHFTFTSFKFKVRWILNTKPRNNENKALMWVENLCYKNFIYFTTSLARHKTLIFHATVSNIFTYHLYNTFRFWDDVQGTKPYGKREWRISTSYFSYSALKAYCIVKY